MKSGLLQLTPSGFNLLCLDLSVENDLPDSPPWLQDYYLKQMHKCFPGSKRKVFPRLALLEMGKTSWQLRSHLSTPVTG